MGKYDRLRSYLRRQRAAELELSFGEIERIIRAMLPNCASLPKWWGNDGDVRDRQLHQAAWRDAGYEALLSKRDERVRFKRFV